ncbi:MAG TPA: aspartyl/asparaginyl beta-hydroxylase domain-containing protein [Rhodocyclaceae bacterium]|nr:aspartyl/asparaginyl beta-hydroxylase domain-containing protein [Rhodocyclaceae bacterium]
MRYLHKLAAGGIDTRPVMLELWRQPDLWGEYGERQVAAGSPHAGASDIWLRYRAREELEQDPGSYLTPHIPVFYPAWLRLPSVRPVVFGLMAACSAVQLGGVMITRLPAGGTIASHDDVGSWHAEFFTTKVYVPLWGNDECWNFCGGEAVVMRPGEAWTFDNLVPHSVENRGPDERVTLIVCLRCE